MLNISKKFTIFSILKLYKNREQPGRFQNKSISFSFK